MKDSTPIAITSRAFSQNPTLRNEILEHFETVRFNEEKKRLSGKELVQFLSGCPKAIVSLEKLDKDVLSQLPDLRVVSKYGVGLDNLDLEEMSRRGILLAWKGGLNRRSVSELVIGLILACYRNIVLSHTKLKQGVWEQPPGLQLSGKKVGLIGCGNVGKDLVALLRPFGCQIFVHDVVDYPDFYEKNGIRSLGLEPLLSESDIVSIHVPYNQTTHNLLSASRLALMKRTAILINTARGGIVDENALKSQLIRGDLFAAAMDVFSVEPPQDPELLALPNFIGTPHIGGSSQDAILAMGRFALEGLNKACPVAETIGETLQ